MKKLILYISLFVCHSISAQNQKPNIIFMFADDLGWGDLSCYGGDRIKTPSLDKLASEGTLFTQFYVAGSVCSPSRAGIMSGQNPSRNRLFGHLTDEEGRNEERGMPDALNPDLFVLTDMLKNEGYTTGHFGKWHLGDVSPAEYGIDVYRSNEHSNVRNGELIQIWDIDERPTITKEILNDALLFIKQHKAQPFYINIWFSDVHATLNPSKEQLDAVNRFKPLNEVDFYGVDQVYLATLLEMDRQIGDFMEKFNELGLNENTLIIFSSDNGPEDYQIRNAAHSGVGSTGPFRGRKRSIYEGGIRMPFILRWPGQVTVNSINNTSVVNGVDFIPTIAGLIGYNLPETIILDGEDMSDVWLGSNRKRKSTLYWEWRFRIFGHVLNRSPMIAIREGDYKLLLNPDNSRIELYDIPNDPGEMNNLVTKKSKLAKKMASQALMWYATIPASPVNKNAGKNDWTWPGE